MKKKFNLLRYKELLKIQESDIDSLSNDTRLQLLKELSSYRADIESQVSYGRKKEYFLLIEKYLNRLIELEDFRVQILKMEDQDGDTAYIIYNDLEKLKDFYLDEDLENFYYPLYNILSLCSEYYEIWYGSIEGISEDKFYSVINNNYSQLKKDFPLDL